MSTEQKNKIKLSLIIVNIERHVLPSWDNNRNNLKTYIYRQTTTLLQILSIEWKDRTSFSLVIISIERYVLSKDDNGDD